MKVKKLHFNWFYSTEFGEDYETYEVGKGGVVEIYENHPQSFRIKFKDGHREIVSNPNHIYYYHEEDK